jgi:succinate dehydrogenase / fumarate reductase membrane anchor subunit
MSRYRSGLWPWLLQRVSALLLLFFIVAHLWIEHFMHLGAPITFHSVAVRLLHWTYAGIDYGLLVVVVYHGLNGLRSIILDAALTPRQVRAVTGGLWILGVVTVIFGINVLSPFLWGRPWFIV